MLKALLYHIFLKIAQNCKATAKPLQRKLQNSKPLKIKHLIKFFAVLQSTAKNIAHQTAHPLGTIFAGKSLVFSIHIFITAKLQKQKTKSKENIDTVALDSFAVFFAVALQLLCSFLHFSQKYAITKPRHPPYPLLSTLPLTHPPTPFSMLKTVENQAFEWCLRSVESQGV